MISTAVHFLRFFSSFVVGGRGGALQSCPSRWVPTVTQVEIKRDKEKPIHLVTRGRFGKRCETAALGKLNSRDCVGLSFIVFFFFVPLSSSLVSQEPVVTVLQKSNARPPSSLSCFFAFASAARSRLPRVLLHTAYQIEKLFKPFRQVLGFVLSPRISFLFLIYPCLFPSLFSPFKGSGNNAHTLPHSLTHCTHSLHSLTHSLTSSLGRPLR